MPAVAGQDDDLAALRRAFGRSAALLGRVEILEDDHFWASISGGRTAGYNLCFTDGGDLPAQVQRAVDLFAEHDVPGLFMMAGDGLAAREELRARDWVKVNTAPLLTYHSAPGQPDPKVVPITADNVDQAREAISSAFGASPELGRDLFNDWTLQHSDVCCLGVLDADGHIVAAMAVTFGAEAVCGWGLGARPDVRNVNAGLRLVAQARRLAWDRDPHTPALSLVSPAGRRLGTTIGARWVEDWEVWSRPRWVLGGQL